MPFFHPFRVISCCRLRDTTRRGCRPDFSTAHTYRSFLTDGVLFEDVWERPALSERDRSLATVAALVALNRPDQLRFHLNFAVQNGVKKEELVELITHLAFYSGWPNAMSAIMVAKEVLSEG